jgi:hypothetical protein
MPSVIYATEPPRPWPDRDHQCPHPNQAHRPGRNRDHLHHHPSLGHLRRSLVRRRGLISFRAARTGKELVPVLPPHDLARGRPEQFAHDGFGGPNTWPAATPPNRSSRTDV